MKKRGEKIIQNPPEGHSHIDWGIKKAERSVIYRISKVRLAELVRNLLKSYFIMVILITRTSPQVTCVSRQLGTQRLDEKVLLLSGASYLRWYICGNIIVVIMRNWCLGVCVEGRAL